MELCTNLQQRVLDLEKTKTTQQNEIASLKRRFKKLEQKKRSRTHRLKRLHKVGMSRRVESSGDEVDLGEDASKQERRINATDADEDITLVSVQDDADVEMFDVGTLTGDEVFAEQEVADAKGVVIEEPNIPVNAASALIKAKVQDKGKGKMVEPEHVKSTKNKVQIMLNEEIALKLQAEIDEEERIGRAEVENIDEANIA
ncbi:hypothetical protein Tco_0164805 [Tanacetum coccineum]